jgi:GTPase SAR1 family protein
MMAAPIFQGRGDILKEMQQHFDLLDSSEPRPRQRRFVLHGLGGTGKTQIVLKFVEESANR